MDDSWVEDRRIFLGERRCRGHALVSPALEQHVASRLAEESAVLKEKRKGREERQKARGAVPPPLAAMTKRRPSGGAGAGAPERARPHNSGWRTWGPPAQVAPFLTRMSVPPRREAHDAEFSANRMEERQRDVLLLPTGAALDRLVYGASTPGVSASQRRQRRRWRKQEGWLRRGVDAVNASTTDDLGRTTTRPR